MELEYQTSGRPFALRPYEYQSTFVPADLGVIQRGLDSRQQRYDTANAAWAETKAKLYDDPTYDINAKNQVIKAIEGDFENIYKEYNGDSGAALEDLMQMIGSHRKNDYFRVNKYALEKQKQYDALRQAYGDKGLEFKGMEKGLINPQTGKLRDTSDFDFEVVQGLERDARLASIIEQSLENVSRESGQSQDKTTGKLVSRTTYGKGLFQTGEKGGVDKRAGIKNEFMKTAEGQQQMRIFKELEGMSDAEADAAMTKYVDDAIANRVAPPSYKYEYDNPIVDKTGGKGGVDATKQPVTKVVTGASASAINNPAIVKTLKAVSPTSVLKVKRGDLFGKDSQDDATRSVALQATFNAAQKPQAKQLLSQMKSLADDLGISLPDFMTDGIFDPGKVKTGTNSSGQVGYYNSNGKFIPINGVYDDRISRTKSDVSKTAREKVLFGYMDKYNKMIDESVKTDMDLTEGDDPYSKWYAIDVQGINNTDEYGNRIPLEESEKTSRRNLVKDAATYILGNVSRGALDFEFGPYAGKHSEELSKDKDFKKLDMTMMSYKPTDDGIRVMLKDNNGDEHTVLINNKDVAVEFSKMVEDKLAEGLAQYTQYKPIYGTGKIEIDGNTVDYADNFSVHKDIGLSGKQFSSVKKDDSFITVQEFIDSYDYNIGLTNDQRVKDALEKQKQDFISQQEARHGEENISDKPVFLHTKAELIPFLIKNGAIR